MTSRKKSPAEPGLGNGECLASLGLRLFTEELVFLLGCKHGPEGSATLTASEAGFVTLVGYLSDNGSINCGVRRGGIGLPPTFFGGELDDFFDAEFRVGVDENHKGGSKPGESRAATGYWCFRTTVMARSRWSLVLFARLARVAALGNRGLLTRHGGRIAAGYLGHVGLSDFNFVLLHHNSPGKRGWLAIAQREQLAAIIVDHGIGAPTFVKFVLQVSGHQIDVFFVVGLRIVLAAVRRFRREDRHLDVLAVPFSYCRGVVARFFAFEIDSCDSHGFVLLFAVGVFGQASRQEVDNRRRRGVGRLDIPTAVEVTDGSFVGQSLDPEFRNAALTQFELRLFGVLGKYQGFEAMAGDPSAYPSAGGVIPPRHLGDLQVVSDVRAVFVFRVHLCSPFGVVPTDINEP